MGRTKPCHMPCGKNNNNHSVPVAMQQYSFAPVTLEKAMGMIKALDISQAVDPWQCPNTGLCYATGTHVLTHAPAIQPASLDAVVLVCRAAYMKWTTHASAHSRAEIHRRAEEQKAQLLAEQETTGDQVDPPASVACVSVVRLSAIFRLLGFPFNIKNGSTNGTPVWLTCHPTNIDTASLPGMHAGGTSC